MHIANLSVGEPTPTNLLTTPIDLDLPKSFTKKGKNQMVWLGPENHFQGRINTVHTHIIILYKREGRKKEKENNIYTRVTKWWNMEGKMN